MTNRELDELICEKVMGLKVIRNETEVPLGWYREVGRDFLGEPRPILDVHTWNATFEKHRGIGFRCTPGYSTDLNEAFRVIEKMRERRVDLQMKGVLSIVDELTESRAQWHFYVFSNNLNPGSITFPIVTHLDESPARAICLCALKVVQEMERSNL